MRSGISKANAVVLGVCLAGAAWLVSGKRLGAQVNTPPEHKKLAPTQLYPISVQAARLPRASGAAAKIPFRLLIADLSWWDLDSDNAVSELEPAAGSGPLYYNNQEVGFWQMTGIHSGIATQGQFQLVLPNGTLTVSTGTPSTTGIKAGHACWSIIGGTGAYAKYTGNCAFDADNTSFYLLPNVK